MSSADEITEGMQVYGADGQLIGPVDRVMREGTRYNLLVGGRAISDTGVRRVEGRRIILSDAGASLQPRGRGDIVTQEPEP